MAELSMDESPLFNSAMLNLAKDIKRWGMELGFNQVGIADTDLSAAEPRYAAWIEKGFHGAMDYMAKHGSKRSRPADLVPGTLRVISVRMDYLAPASRNSEDVLQHGEQAFISRYALGRDYHKVLRKRLQKLCDRIGMELAKAESLEYRLTYSQLKESQLASSELPRLAAPDITSDKPRSDRISPDKLIQNKQLQEKQPGTEQFDYRVFTDSAPVMEVSLAEKAGLGWRGKHTLLLSREAGSFFFLGEIYTNLPLPIDTPLKNHCGTCTACLDVCPTQAIVAPYEVDARRCISYLTIELKGSIPEPLRPLIGNRIYGCDDCQLTCPWNRFSHITQQDDFQVRHGLDDISLVELFSWDETSFEQKLAGTSIYRIGYQQWLRNIAVGLGNAPTSPAIVNALKSRIDTGSPLLQEHIHWALAQHS